MFDPPIWFSNRLHEDLDDMLGQKSATERHTQREHTQPADGKTGVTPATADLHEDRDYMGNHVTSG